MTDHRLSDPGYAAPPANHDIDGNETGAGLLGWIIGAALGIAVTIVFLVAWNGNVRTATGGPTAMVGAGPVTLPLPAPVTTAGRVQ